MKKTNKMKPKENQQTMCVHKNRVNIVNVTKTKYIDRLYMHLHMCVLCIEK